MIAWINRNRSIAGSTEAQYVVGMVEAASTEEKERFAKAWLTHGEPRKAAFSVWPLEADVGLACFRADTLPFDVETLQIRDRLLKDYGGKSAFLPDKDDLARMALQLASEKEGEDWKHSAHSRLNAFRFYAELQGFVDPKGSRGESNAQTATKDEILEVIANAMPD